MATRIQRLNVASFRRTFAKTWTCYLFILPNLVGVVVFLAYPIVFSLYISLTKWDFVSPPEFVGLRNYIRLFTRDRLFFTSMTVTIKYVLMAVPSGLVASLVVALALGEGDVVVTLEDIINNLVVAVVGKIILGIIALALLIYGLKQVRLVK